MVPEATCGEMFVDIITSVIGIAMVLAVFIVSLKYSGRSKHEKKSGKED